MMPATPSTIMLTTENDGNDRRNVEQMETRRSRRIHHFIISLCDSF